MGSFAEPSYSALPIGERATVERVKTVALATGVRIAPAVLDELGGVDSLTIHEYATTGGVTLELPGDVLVNAPFDEPSCAGTPLALERGQNGLELRLGDEALPVVRVLPLPGFLHVRDAAGRLVRSTVMSHADRVRVSPIVGCAYNCRFCDLGTLRYVFRPVEQLLAAIDVAAADASVLPARHVLISGGSPAPKHHEYFDDVCVRIVEHVKKRDPSMEVDVMMSARPDGPAFVERLVDAGLDGFSLNLELYSEAASERELSLKHRRARPHLKAIIDAAVERLGRGTGRVRSLVILGLEPLAASLEGIAWLASRGCHPVLSPFRPTAGTPLAGAVPASAELLEEALVEARRIVAAHEMTLGPHCVPCQHNTLTFPWDVPAPHDR